MDTDTTTSQTPARTEPEADPLDRLEQEMTQDEARAVVEEIHRRRWEC